MVFSLGMLLGLLYFLSLIGLASAAGQFVGVFGGLGLALAAPLCWLAAVRTRAGDRFTLMYFLAWVLMIVASALVGIAEMGKQVQSGNGAGVVALVLVAVVYLVVVPLVVHRYRQQARAGGWDSRARRPRFLDWLFGLQVR
jgi:fucose 4-O-acetylase-like acetyltransferase